MPVSADSLELSSARDNKVRDMQLVHADVQSVYTIIYMCLNYFEMSYTTESHENVSFFAGSWVSKHKHNLI